jgi:hypothetical protein
MPLAGVGRVPAMRARRPLLHVAAIAVAVAVGVHLLMHVQTHPVGVAAAMAVHADHVTTPTTAIAAGAAGHTSGGHGHLMAALCMAVLADAAVTLGFALVAAANPHTTPQRVATPRLPDRLLRAPPAFLSRIDAGVLLRV